MRLSDAIATGRMVVQPYPNYLLVRGGRGCALGMAGVAAGLKISEMEESYEAIYTEWPWLLQSIKPGGMRCPLCSKTEKHPVGFYDYLSAIQHLFDLHIAGLNPKWTLDQLIDWVRSVEPAEPEQSIEVQPEVEAKQTVSLSSAEQHHP